MVFLFFTYGLGRVSNTTLKRFEIRPNDTKINTGGSPNIIESKRHDNYYPRMTKTRMTTPITKANRVAAEQPPMPNNRHCLTTNDLQ